MNQIKTQSLHFLKRTLHFVLSITVFALFVWYFSGFSILPQSFNVYFSTFLFSLFNHTLERKYMFLLCNGILAFLAKSSLSSSTVPSTSALEIQFQTPNNLSETKKPVSDDDILVSLESLKSLENVPLMAEEEEEEDRSKEVSVEEREEGTENETSVSEQNQVEVKNEDDGGGGDCEEEEGEGGTESEVLVKQDDDEKILGNEEIVNADELNRKFEEFIRKMKEEMRIEAQQQLIAV